MNTSYFSISAKNPLAVSIYPKEFTPKWFIYPIAKELAPSKKLCEKWMNNRILDEEYANLYYDEVISLLNPFEIYQKYKRSILLGWRSVDNNFCHRLIIASWIKKEIGENVIEIKK